MTHTLRFLASGFLAAAGLFTSLPMKAANVASDNAGNYTSTSYNGASGSNAGMGFGAFSVRTAGTGYSGTFIQTNSSQITSSGGNVFDLYGTQGGRTDVIRSFAADGTSGSAGLTVGQTFSTQFENNSINTGTNLGTPDSAGFFVGSSTASRFTFSFTGGDSDYFVTDSTGSHDTGIGYTKNGLTTSLTMTGVDTYSFRVNNLSGAQLYSISGTLASSGANISQIDYFVNNAGDSNDVFFNNLSITGTPVPEPATVAGGFLCAVLAGSACLRRRQAARPA